MTQFQSLLLTALIVLAFRPEPLAAQVAPVVCNDGQIPVNVARAYKDMHNWPSSGDWTVQGWYPVSPGQCQAIGPEHYYTVGAEFSDETYSLTLLAFAFTDSTGVWGSARVSEPDPREAEKAYKASNQQLCVQNQAFLYTRSSTSQGEPAKECDRGLPGYYRIPASLAFYGENNVFVSKKTLHVSFGPNDRAIPLGTQAPPQTPNNPSANSGSNSSHPPLSPSQQATQQAQARATMLGWVREDVAAYIAASRNGFEAYKTGQPQVSQGLRMWPSSVKPAFAKNCWVVQGDTTTTFSCLLSEKPDLNATRAEYTELTGDVTASLPPDWHPETAPPFGPDFPASQAYRSSSGSHGEIWIARAASGGGYELHYQLVSAGQKP